MCSNTSSGSYGDPNDYSGACLKKQKKEKVPRRGPGVAELEKILREQEKGFTATALPPDSSSPFFSPSSYSVMDQSIFGPLLPSPPPPPPQPPVTALYNCSNSSFKPPPVTTNIGCNVMPPEKTPIFPMLFAPSRPNSDAIDSRATVASSFSFSYFPKDLIPPAPVFQRKQHSLHQVQMVNLPQHVTVPALTNPPPVGLFQFIEPPSNQRSCPKYTSQLLEEDVIVGTKRPRNFLLDRSVDSHMNTNFNVGPAKTTSRDANQSYSLDLRLKSSIPDYGTTSSGNPITVDSPSPAAPPTPIQTCTRGFSSSKFTPLTLQYEPQENVEDYVQRGTVTEVSVNRKPFYSFLPLQSGDEEQTFGMKNEKFEANRDRGIDLRLKL